MAGLLASFRRTRSHRLPWGRRLTGLRVAVSVFIVGVSRWSAWFDGGDKLHLHAAVRTTRDWGFGQHRFGFVELAAHQRAHAQPGLARRAAHPAVVANPHKSLGQHMGEPAHEESLHRKRDDMRPVRAALKTLETDAALRVVTKDALWAERGAEDVAREVANRWSAATGVNDVGDPLAAEHLGMLLREAGVEFGVIGFERDLKAVAEAHGQGRTMK